MPAIDVIVIGLGAVGSAALHCLALRRRRVVGIEQFTPGHDRGSSHGETRVIRLGYFEHPSYVPLVRAALPLWRALEAQYRRQLLHVTGVLEIGPPDSTLVTGTLRASREHSLAHEVLDARTLMQRFPAFRLPPNFVGVFQPDGGFLQAEAAVAAQLALAVAAGAEIRERERVRAILPRAGSVRVETDAGNLDAGAVVIAAGPWLPLLVPRLPLRVTRQMLAWFAPNEPEKLQPDTCPVFLLESTHGLHYGFPYNDRSGIKIAKHHHLDQTVDPNHYDRRCSEKDEAAIRAALTEHLPAANGRLLASKSCLYTMAPDGDFIIDHVPGHPDIVVASPCSGHGFKFAPVIGEILADLALEGRTSHDISRFRLNRFAPA